MDSRKFIVHSSPKFSITHRIPNMSRKKCARNPFALPSGSATDLSLPILLNNFANLIDCANLKCSLKVYRTGDKQRERETKGKIFVYIITDTLEISKYFKTSKTEKQNCSFQCIETLLVPRKKNTHTFTTPTDMLCMYIHIIDENAQVKSSKDGRENENGDRRYVFWKLQNCIYRFAPRRERGISFGRYYGSYRC